jgi:hypothetical protein
MTPAEFRAARREFIARETKLKGDKETVLRACGWSYTSDFPDCRWRWCKTIQGERVTAHNADEALHIQQFLTGEES